MSQTSTYSKPLRRSDIFKMESIGVVLAVCLVLACLNHLSAGVEGKFRHELGLKYRRSSRNIRYDVGDGWKLTKAETGERRNTREIPASIRYLLDIDYQSGLLDYIKYIQNKGDQGNCTRTSLARFDYEFPQSSYDRFAKQMDEAVNTASFVGGVFQTNKPGKARRDDGKKKKFDLRFNDGFYFSLVRWMVESDSLIFGCAIGFEMDLYYRRGNQPTSFCPYAYKDTKTGKTIVKDLSRELLYYHNRTTGCEWYREQKFRNFSHLFNQNTTHFPAYSDSVGDVLDNVSVTSATRKEGLWSPPYFDCAKGANWLVTYSVPFFDVGHGFVGVVAVDIDLKNLDINQCSEKGPFAGTHKCSMETTQCKHMPGYGFHRGNYRCYCKDGFYFPPNPEGVDYFNGSLLEEEFIRHSDRNLAGNPKDNNQCLPCARGCHVCTNNTPCFVEYDVLLRGIPLGIQSFCMTITLVLGFILIRLRRNRVMKSSMWVMLEILLFGALLLFSTVVIQYFEPNTTTCLLIPWFREVGFAIVYGALILKVYRVLAEFQSRKAHRVHVRDRDLLKYLLGIALIVIGYMSAWTAVNMDHVRENDSLLDEGITPDKTKYVICKSHWWDYVIEIGEILFLCLGIYLCYCVRSAPSEYGEIRYISWAIYNETVMSTILYVLRHFLWLTVNPDYIFLMYFIRCQLTVTVTLILVLGPKLWYAHRPPDDDTFRTRAFSTSDVHDTILPESMKLHVGISSNGDVDVGEINLAEMDPEDIRAELKRLYTQLQIYKTKTMRKDNPHISKRRGGRKQTHRRFSLQAFRHHRSHHHHDEHEHELSKTPEESTNSAEGVNIALDGSSRAEEGSHVLPSVTFKTSHK